MFETTVGTRPTAGRIGLVLLAIISLMLSALAVASPVLSANDKKDDDPPPENLAQHCPDKDNVNKVEANASGAGTTTINGVTITSAGNTLTFTNANLTSTAVISWCAKGGRQFTGPGDTDANYNTGVQSQSLTAGGTAGATATVTFNVGKNVSYFIPYTVTLTPLTGTIIIVKDTVPNAAQDFAFTTTGTGLSGFSLDDDADNTLSNTRTFTGLAAGPYSVTEGADAGYTLSNLTCTTGGVGSTTTRTATITLAAGQTVTCTFQNTVNVPQDTTGEIAIFKTMCASIGQQDTCNGRDTSLNNYMVDFRIYPGDDNVGEFTTATVTLGENAEGQGNTGAGSQGRVLVEGLAPGTYTVCEIPVAYLLNAAGTARVDEVELDAVPRPEAGNGGSTGGSQTQLGNTDCIIVTVTNGRAEVKFLDVREDSGSITIVKNAIPDDAQDFAFTTTGTGLSAFSLDDDTNPTLPNQRTFTGLADGAYSVTESDVEGWTLDNVTCSAGGTVDATNPSRVNITIAGGTDVTCTFVNEEDAVVQLLGSITIIKNTIGDDAQDFGFTATGTGLSNFTLDDDANPALSNQRTFSNLAAGSYTVAENATAGWGLTSLTCSTGGAVDATNPRQANITLAAGANVTCTFVNSRVREGTLSNNPVRGGTLTGTGVPNTATTPDAGISFVAILGMLLVTSAGMALSANVALSSRRRR
jgi:hypothetical protein